MRITPEITARRIIEYLQAMDQEADTKTTKGTPTGLHWYGGHVRPDQQRPQTEPHWSKHIAERLAADGLQAAAEVAYREKPGNRCDVVVTSGDETFWIEIKGAWKEYCHRTGTTGNYNSYLLHPLVPGLDATKGHTAALDIQKVAEATTATWIGFLLVGFDSDERPMDEDVMRLARLAGIDRLPWYCITSGWPDPYRPGERVRCWFWFRQSDTS